MREQFVQLLLSTLIQSEAKASVDFRDHKQKLGIGFCCIDHLLPMDYANRIAAEFDSKNPVWREMNTFREKKLTTKKFDELNPLLKDITFAFQDPRVIQAVEKITGIPKQLPDQYLYAGGLSLMRKDDFLDPHIDNSHDQFQKVYRRLNLLYYVTPDWKIENGGNLELWDQKVSQPVTIHSAFNRLVLMETHRFSWHSVSKVNYEGHRACVSNYYFSEESPSGQHYDHITSFMGRPEQPFKRLFSKADNRLRSLLRVIKKSGFGKKDVYVQKV